MVGLVEGILNLVRPANAIVATISLPLARDPEAVDRRHTWQAHTHKAVTRSRDPRVGIAEQTVEHVVPAMNAADTPGAGSCARVGAISSQ